MSNKWYDIGIQLRVDTQRLDHIKQQYSDYADGLREMLKVSLRQPLDWGMLVAALRSPAVGAGGAKLLDSDDEGEVIS